jgi:lipoprotein-anchoring transpeptidase ErfK/SrfK
VRVPAETVQPKVTSDRVAAKYPTVVTVDRAGFRLHLFKNLKLVKSYPIAVGRQGLETPAGLYPVQDKQINPVWHVPNSSWAGALAGKTIPPGPADPIKARWIGITGGAGIHGTTEIGSLGSAASHGCIRMAIPDVIDLFDRVPYGSMIYVA